MAITLVIPVFNDAQSLVRCLAALKHSRLQPAECIVVDDSSTDDSAEVARRAGASVIHTPSRMGPAAARNCGAALAKSDLLVFLDSDVCLHPGTLSRIQARFDNDARLAALIGSYDDEPESPGLVSQYKNLLHHFMHQHSRRDASTFWTGCGAIRRHVFARLGGFDQRYLRPSIEDIALGCRLRRAGYRIALDTAVQVKHLKRWTLASLIRTDIFDRALPWTRLILRSASLPNDLNLSVAERCNAVLALVLAALAALLAASGRPAFAAGALLAAAAVPARFCRFVARKRGWFTAAGFAPLHLAYYLYSCLAFAAGLALHLVLWRWQPDPLFATAPAASATRPPQSPAPADPTAAAPAHRRAQPEPRETTAVRASRPKPAPRTRA
jgi:GT2 family glycosyltransferase